MLVYDPSKNYQKTVTRKLIDPLLTSVPSDASDYANTISWITSNSTLAVSAWNNNPANPPVIEFHISGNGLFGNLTGKAITTDFPAGTSISDLSISPDATKILAVSFKRN